MRDISERRNNFTNDLLHLNGFHLFQADDGKHIVMVVDTPDGIDVVTRDLNDEERRYDTGELLVMLGDMIVEWHETNDWKWRESV